MPSPSTDAPDPVEGALPAVSPGRSRNMRAIKRADTKPELRLRAALHAAGLRFRKDLRLELEGKTVRPDVVFTRRRVAVFVDGCFWHSCPIHGRAPTTNQSYWGPKLARTAVRDRAADEALGGAGWTVVRVWEHLELKEAVRLVTEALSLPREPRTPPKPQAVFER
ncbi:very short patch repair endonuclease [Aquipuribacter sp. SD81]|uniref:very short patch repair endonuclease n=1 Tax=Aquipuribacter sp. SD81 TaxID=3127703 RepID=UPI0030180C51